MTRNNNAQVLSDRKYQPKNLWNIPFVLLLVFASVLIFFVRFNSGEIDQTNFNTFSSDQKKEWLLRQADLINKSDQGIKFFREKLAKIDERYKDYGVDKSNWPVNIKLLYDEDRKPAQYNLENAVRERNELASLYNLNFSIIKKMNPEGYNIKKLPERFEEVKL